MAGTPHEQDQLWVYNPTTSPFTVHWGGYPYTIQSGEKRVYPRFIANHFAKHLADAILLRKEDNYQKENGKAIALLRSPTERPKIVNMILIGTYSHFQGEPTDVGAIINQTITQTNGNLDMSLAPNATEDKTVYEDYGLLPDPAIGELAAPEVPDTSSITSAPLPPAPVAPEGELIGGTSAPAPPAGKQPELTLAELKAEADALDIKYPANIGREALLEKIKNF